MVDGLPNDLRGKAVVVCGAADPALADAVAGAFEAFGARVHRLASDEAIGDALRTDHDQVEALVLATAPPAAESAREATRVAFQDAVSEQSWPLVGALQRVREAFGRYPRYTVALSSLTTASYEPGAETVALANCVLEILCRYMTAELLGEDARVNAVRSAADVAPQEVARVVVALCSGLLDGVKGQILTVDGGRGFGIQTRSAT